MKYFLFLLSLALLTMQCRNKSAYYSTPLPANVKVPSSIIETHEELLHLVSNLASLQDSTGRKAKELLDILKYHFSEEEEYVFPPLGMISSAATGRIPEDSKAIVALTEKFRNNSAKILAEHQMIKKLLDDLSLTAVSENHTEAENCKKKILAHAKEEEEILFPAVIVLEDYLLLKSPTK